MFQRETASRSAVGCTASSAAWTEKTRRGWASWRGEEKDSLLDEAHAMEHSVVGER